jgi:gephyrin
MVENMLPETATADRSEETSVRITTYEAEIRENIREPGSNIKHGSLILRKGTTISSISGEVGSLATAGIRDVSVY